MIPDQPSRSVSGTVGSGVMCPLDPSASRGISTNIQERSQNQVRPQLLGVQALRGLAAILVAIAHLLEHGLGEEVPHVLLFGGRFGVVIFFVISGFVIHYASGASSIAPGAFAIRRLMRIAPLYWATTLTVATCSLIAPQIFKTTSFDLVGLIKSLLFIPYESPEGSMDWRPLFKLGWTLNYEIFFYTMTLALFWCRSARLRAIGLTVILCAFILRMQFPRDPHSIIAFYASYNLLPFLAGVWIAEAFRSGIFHFMQRRVARIAVPLAGILVILLYAAPISITANSRLWPLTMTLPAVSLMVAALSLERDGRNVPFLLWIGDISYSIYLLHMFIVGAIWAVIHKLHPSQPGWPLITMIVISGFLITLAVSHISYRWFEMPINRLGSRLAKRL